MELKWFYLEVKKKVLQMHNQANVSDLGDDSMSLSLSENESLSSLSNL